MIKKLEVVYSPGPDCHRLTDVDDVINKLNEVIDAINKDEDSEPR